jgi:hypothetical protein
MLRTDKNTASTYLNYHKSVNTPIEKKEYLKITNLYMKFLFDKVLAGNEVILPSRLGSLFITGTKKKLKFDADGIPMLPPNWGETKKLWDRDPEAKLNKKLVYCLNEETNGVVYKLHWSKNRVFVENKSFYSLRITRANKRAIHKSITQGVEYIIKTL